MTARLFKPGDRVAVCTTDEMGNQTPAWGNIRAGETGTVIAWDEHWQAWSVEMDDAQQGSARWPTTYLKPVTDTIDDVERFLAS